MNVKELIATLSRTKWELETELEENGGELTDELLAKADTLEEMKSLLAGEGIDELGRWLKSVQDELAARKAEADAAARRVKNLKGYEDYVKHLIGEALDATGQESAKGSFYGFKRTTSNRAAVNQESLNEHYLEIAQAGARMNGLPDYIDVVLKATATDLREAGGNALDFLEETSEPAIRFTKPRASKE